MTIGKHFFGLVIAIVLHPNRHIGLLLSELGGLCGSQSGVMRVPSGKVWQAVTAKLSGTLNRYTVVCELPRSKLAGV